MATAPLAVHLLPMLPRAPRRACRVPCIRMIAHCFRCHLSPESFDVSVIPSNRGSTGFVPFWLRRISILRRFTMTGFISDSHTASLAPHPPDAGSIPCFPRGKQTPCGWVHGQGAADNSVTGHALPLGYRGLNHGILSPTPLQGRSGVGWNNRIHSLRVRIWQRG